MSQNYYLLFFKLYSKAGETSKMNLFTIADLHLPLGADKPMDIFGGWDNYVERLQKNWGKLVNEDDLTLNL